MSIRKNKKGFTLIEILVTVSIVAMMGLAVYSAFAKGVAVWELGGRIDEREREIRFALENIATELRNSFYFSGIGFGGTKEQVWFPAYIKTGGAAGRPRVEPGRVAYYFDGAKNALQCIQKNYIDIFREESPPAKEVIPDITGLEFGYYNQNITKKSYEWADSWQGRGGRPLGVRISVNAKVAGEEKKFVKTVYFP
jgi:prepilin-type N-terminal cleavage/methylation domain-containing protein